MADHDFTEEHAGVFRQQVRPVAHLRQQVAANRLCLIFGAGAGYDLGFQQWKDLLERLGNGLESFDEAKGSADNEVGLAQLLLKTIRIPLQSVFSATKHGQCGFTKSHAAARTAAWRSRLYEALYVDANKGQTDGLLRTNVVASGINDGNKSERSRAEPRLKSALFSCSYIPGLFFSNLPIRTIQNRPMRRR